jgi:hypothetical protein
MTTLIMTGFHRDLGKKRSHVSITWDDDDAEKRRRSVYLRIPSDCDLADLKAETEKAVRALAMELESATVERVS